MKTVLLVEDEKMIRQGIRAMIQRSGVPVENIMECNNGEMALAVLKDTPVDYFCLSLIFRTTVRSAPIRSKQLR